MAPKKRAAELQAPAAMASNEANRAIDRALAEDLAVIRSHALFKAIERAAPAAIDVAKKELSGNQAIYDAEHYAASIQASGLYKCGGNFFWQNALFTPAPGVPLNQNAIESLVNFYFQTPAAYPLSLLVALPNKDYDPMVHKGALRSCSPDEMKVAFIRAIAQAVRRPDDEEVDKVKVLTQWRHVALTCTLEFTVLESEDDVYFAAVNLRERFITEYHTLSRTAYQKVCDIYYYKQRKEAVTGGPMTAKKISEEYNARAKLAAETEPVSPDYVGACLTVWSQILSVPAARAAIEAGAQLRRPVPLRQHLEVARRGQEVQVDHHRGLGLRVRAGPHPLRRSKPRR